MNHQNANSLAINKQAMLNDITQSLAHLKDVQKQHSDLVKKYISEHVDFTDRDSVERAIFDLPESVEKLLIYDAMYDFDDKEKLEKGE